MNKTMLLILYKALVSRIWTAFLEGVTRKLLILLNLHFKAGCISPKNKSGFKVPYRVK